MLNRVSPARSGVDLASAPDWIDRARALRPLISAAADRIEQEREIPEEVVAALHEAQLFRMLLPRSCGGGEVEPAIYVQVIEEIAKADASAAWCLGQANGGTVAGAYLDPEAARTVFGDPRAVVASGPNFGTAVAVDGGYRVTGTWPFASGRKHAIWLAGHCLVQEPDGKPRLYPDGKPFERTMFFPKEKATFKDIWHVMGLKGTGSDQFTVTDLFVPEDLSFTREWPPDRRENGPLYRFSNYQLFGVGFAGVALGIARATLDDFIALAREKAPRNSPQVLRDNALIQFQVGHAEAQLQSVRTFMVQTMRDLWDAVATGDTMDADQRARLRMTITFASQQSRDIVDVAYHAAGASAIFENNPFERRFRDVHTVSQQVQGHSSNFELLGQRLLGLDPVSKYL
jgi:alkylation response protein AidB-like acyl-CoA dehydrogenase